jgi:hypothetical protein
MDKEKELESYEWICRIIGTCNNTFHFEAVQNLIELHYQNFKNEDLKVELGLLKSNKWKEVHNVLG